MPLGATHRQGQRGRGRRRGGPRWHSHPRRGRRLLQVGAGAREARGNRGQTSACGLRGRGGVACGASVWRERLLVEPGRRGRARQAPEKGLKGTVGSPEGGPRLSAGRGERRKREELVAACASVRRGRVGGVRAGGRCWAGHRAGAGAGAGATATATATATRGCGKRAAGLKKRPEQKRPKQRSRAQTGETKKCSRPQARRKKCVAQAGLELVILLPLPPSANPTGVRHHNRRKNGRANTYSNLTHVDVSLNDTPPINHARPPPLLSATHTHHAPDTLSPSTPPRRRPHSPLALRRHTSRRHRRHRRHRQPGQDRQHRRPPTSQTARPLPVAPGTHTHRRPPLASLPSRPAQPTRAPTLCHPARSPTAPLSSLLLLPLPRRRPHSLARQPAMPEFTARAPRPRPVGARDTRDLRFSMRQVVLAWLRPRLGAWASE